jgi:hypothetical protein
MAKADFGRLKFKTLQEKNKILSLLSYLLGNRFDWQVWKK